MLRDYRWIISGVSQVTEDLSLKNAILQVTRVDYSPITRVARIEIAFKEGDGVYEHRRNFNYTLPDESVESISASNITALINYFFPTAQVYE